MASDLPRGRARGSQPRGCGGCTALEGPCPMNLWLHESGHWHIEVVPRLTVLAGIELGAGIFVNPLRARRRQRRASRR